MKNLLITTALCFAATGAAAELTYGSAFANYHSFDSDDGDTSLRTYGGAAEYRFNNFLFSGEAGRISTGEGDVDQISIGLGYTLQNGVTLGVDHSRIELDDLDADITSVYMSYTFSQYTLGLSVGDSSDLNDTSYGIYGAWDVTEDGTVGFDLVRIDEEDIFAGYASYDLQQYSVEAQIFLLDDLEIYSIDGSYNLRNGFSIIGGLSMADLDGDDLTAFTVGAQYAFAPGANVEVALGRIDVDGGENIDRMTFGLNYEFGARTSKRRTVGNILLDATATTVGLTEF